MVNKEEEMAFGDLTITGNYSDYDIWRKKRILLLKTTKFGSKPKKKYGEGEYC